jgi:hypothetical protein
VEALGEDRRNEIVAGQVRVEALAGGGRDVAEREDEEDGEVEEAGEGGEDEEAVMEERTLRVER